MENLHKVGGSIRRLNKAKSLLWRGQVDEAQKLFVDLTKKTAQNLVQYLEKHRHRIVNYEYFQSEQICSIGSGAVESAIKQIDRRTKISGARREASPLGQLSVLGFTSFYPTYRTGDRISFYLIHKNGDRIYFTKK